MARGFFILSAMSQRGYPVHLELRTRAPPCNCQERRSCLPQRIPGLQSTSALVGIVTAYVPFSPGDTQALCIQVQRLYKRLDGWSRRAVLLRFAWPPPITDVGPWRTSSQQARHRHGTIENSGSEARLKATTDDIPEQSKACRKIQIRPTCHKKETVAGKEGSKICT